MKIETEVWNHDWKVRYVVMYLTLSNILVMLSLVGGLVSKGLMLLGLIGFLMILINSIIFYSAVKKNKLEKQYEEKFGGERK